MNNQYFKLKIPFMTKALIWNKQKGLKIKGNAVFIFDIKENKYINEYLELDKANYRITDKNMLKTAYYKNKHNKNFRDKYLDKFNVFDPVNIHTVQHIDLTNKQIDLINNIFQNTKTTIKVMFSFLSGSHISGSETNHKSSPLVCTEDRFFQCNFANVINRKTYKGKYKIIDDTKLTTYSLVDVIENDLIKNFKENFYKYNEHIEFENNLIDYNFQEEFENVPLKQNIVSINNLEFPTERQKNYIHLNLENINEDGYHKKRLRAFYSQNVRYCLINNIIKYHSTKYKNNLKLVENAHILSFSHLLSLNNEESIWEAIDPFNCLRIDSGYHTLWDKKEIYFSKVGDAILIKNDKVIAKEYLELNSLAKKQKEYFIRYLKSIDKQ